MKELKNGTPVKFKYGEFSGNGEICGIHYQYVGDNPEPFIFYIVEAYDFPNDAYAYSHLLMRDENITN